MKAITSIVVPIIIWLLFLFTPQHPLRAQGDSKEGPKENRLERARWRYQMRADEQGVIPFGSLLRAKDQMDRLREFAPPRVDAGIANWEWLGPGNIGGRIRSILIHPTFQNVMWIGGVSGGIWRTNDGGGNWFPISDFMANLAITSLVMDPTNFNVMYASTGEAFGNTDGLQGAGIFKSLDGGNTWDQLPFTDTPNFQWVTRLAHHPSTSGILLATTANGVFGNIWRTTDGGNSWTSAQATIGSGLDVKFNPGSGNQAMAGSSTDLYNTTNAGVTWSRETSGAAGKLPSSPGRCEVAFGQNGIMYASLDRNSGEIWRSDDSGTTWSLRNTGTNYLAGFGWYANAIWVDPTNQNRVVVGGIDLWRSTDGGSTLTQISLWQNFNNGGPANSAHGDQHVIVHHPGFNGTSNTIVFFGNDGGIQMAADVFTVQQTSGWTNLAFNLGITQFYAGAAAPDGSIIVGGSQDNDKLHYTPANGVNNWRQPESGDGGYAAVDYYEPNYVYGEYIYLNLVRSNDGGNTYQPIVNGLTDTCDLNNCGRSRFISPFSMDPQDPTILIAGGQSIWRTTNRGDNWSSIRPPIAGNPRCTAIDISRASSNFIWVGYDNGRVSLTFDGGNIWTDVDGGIPDRLVTDIAINPQNYLEAFVTINAYLSDNVWMTTNAGTNWIRRTGIAPNILPAIQVNTVRYNPVNTNWIYVGTDLGVLASEDKGITWNVTPRFGINEGPVNVEVDELFWQGTEYLIAATHGRGMFRARILQTVFVDIANNGFENGTLQFPYNTIQEAIDVAGNGSDISIKAGIYPQAPVTLFRRGIVWPRDGVVEIRGTAGVAGENPSNDSTGHPGKIPEVIESSEKTDRAKKEKQ